MYFAYIVIYMNLFIDLFTNLIRLYTNPHSQVILKSESGVPPGWQAVGGYKKSAKRPVPNRPRTVWNQSLVAT